MRRNSSRFAALLGVCAMTITMSSCGGAAESKGDSSSSSGLSADTQAAVDAAYEGTFGTPPTSSPRPEPGKNIWLVTLSPQIIDYRQPGQMVEAAELIGWDLTVFDGQFNPDTVVNGLRQAIADKADGVILATVDCALAKAGLQDVEQAGIPVVALESNDCDINVDDRGVSTDSGEPALFDAQVTYDNPAGDGLLSFTEAFHDLYADIQALGLASATRGKGRIIKLRETDTAVTLVTDHGFDAALKKHCPDCEIVETVDFVGTDFGAGLQQKVEQAIAGHPEANALYTVYDAAALEAAPAVLASGRAADIFVMGGEGTAGVVDLIREGRGVSAGAGYSVRWEAWAALDAMNRLLHGEKPEGVGFPSGMGVQLFDKDHNLPPKGERFDGPGDFEAAYRSAWGVGQG